MADILKVLNNFQGIIGTILGSVTTLIVTDILKKKGKLKIYLISYDEKFQTFKDVGCSCRDKTDDDFYGYSVNYVIQVYNNSDTPKIMRDFKIVFKKNSNNVFTIVPSDETTRRYSAHSYKIDEMEISNIEPKKIQVIKQSIYVIYDLLDKIEGSNRVELQYRDEKDKVRKILLSNRVVTQSNYIEQ